CDAGSALHSLQSRPGANPALRRAIHVDELSAADCDLAGILVVIVGSPVAGRRLWWDGKRELRPESRHPICPGEYPASGPSYRRRNARAARRASGPAASMGPLGARLWSQQHGAIDGNELTL